jgi:hypothetical protein
MRPIEIANIRVEEQDFKDPSNYIAMFIKCIQDIEHYIGDVIVANDIQHIENLTRTITNCKDGIGKKLIEYMLEVCEGKRCNEKRMMEILDLQVKNVESKPPVLPEKKGSVNKQFIDYISGW